MSRCAEPSSAGAISCPMVPTLWHMRQDWNICSPALALPLSDLVAARYLRILPFFSFC